MLFVFLGNNNNNKKNYKSNVEIVSYTFKCVILVDSFEQGGSILLKYVEFCYGLIRFMEESIKRRLIRLIDLNSM